MEGDGIAERCGPKIVVEEVPSPSGEAQCEVPASDNVPSQLPEDIAQACDVTSHLESLQQLLKHHMRALEIACTEEAALIDSGKTRDLSEADVLVDQTVAQALTEVAAQHDADEGLLKSIENLKDPTEVDRAVRAAAQRGHATAQCVASASGAASELLDAGEAHYRRLIGHQQKSIESIIASVRRELSEAAAAMDQLVSRAETELLTKRGILLASQEQEFESLLKQYADLSEDLMQQRLKKRQVHHASMEDIHAREHAQHAALRQDLAQRIADATCQLSVDRGTRLLTRDKLGYNCRILEERRKENKTALVEQSRQVHKLAASLAALKSEYSKLDGQTRDQVAAMLQRAKAADEAVETLQAKAENFRKAEQIEVSKMTALKEAAFEEYGRRLALAIEKIRVMGGEEVDIQSICKSKAIRGTLLSDPEPSGDLIPAVRCCAECAAGSPPPLDPIGPISMLGKQTSVWASRALQMAPILMREGLLRLEEAAREELKLDPFHG